VRFVLLGSVRGWADDHSVDLGPARQRCVLAALLAESGRSVSTKTLIDRVWGSEPPTAVRSTLYSYITRLRDVLRYAGGDQTLTRVDGGYRLNVRPDAVDLWQWDALLEQARAATTDAQRAERLDQALRLWADRPLANLAGEWAEQVRQRLERQRITALAEWAELEIEAGRPADVALALSDPVAQHPAAESLVAALMRALHLSGRSADALECYARVRARTTTEFGIEPGHVLRELHLEILRSDQEEAAPRAGPAQLPAAVADFTGRRDALGRLDTLLAPTRTAVKIAVIAGTAGVGKTALAVQWAHRAAGRFPDGQIQINLHGYSKESPVEPARALELLLQALGVPADRIPADVDARVGLYRSSVAGRRMLIVLDNANSPEQVRPLLPGEPGCGVLITSRDALGGLVAVDGARRIHLDVLGEDDALALLVTLLGDDRAHDRESTTALAQACARLPLALRIAAANLGDQPIGDYVRALSADPLSGLSVDGDPDAVVGAQFEYSYRNLDPEQRRLFCYLGFLPGVDVSVYSAAALIGSTVDQAAKLLRRLTNAHLIEHVWSRYTFHDLLRAYAAHCGERDIAPAERDAALRRFFDWHLHTAGAAMDVVDPNRRRMAPSEPTLPALAFESYEEALSWLDLVCSTLVALTADAVARGWDDRAWRLPQVVWRYFFVRGGVTDWTTTHELALTAARRLGDRRAEAETLNNLATADRRAGRNAVARERLELALDLFGRMDDQRGVATVLGSLGVVHHRLGHSAQAIDCHRRALALHQHIDDRRHEAAVLGNLGGVFQELGRYDEALEQFRCALDVFRQVSDRRGEAISIANLGLAYQHLGNDAAAIENHQRALAMHRRNGDRSGEATVLTNLGFTLCRVDRHSEALARQHEALSLAVEFGERDLETEIENDLGETYQAAGDHAGALARHRRALELCADSGNRLQLARAHHGMARAQLALGNQAAAREHWRAALDIYTDIGGADADELRKELAGIDAGGQP